MPYTSLDCIALRTVRYSDRTSILTAYTRQRGRVSLSVPAGIGRGAARVRALTQPLGRFECEADIKPGRDIFAMRDVRAVGLPPSGGSPLKAAQALFLADFLGALLREPLEDAALFDFIADAAERLWRENRPTALANFHLCLMVRLLRFAGIEPDWGTYRPGAVFDYLEGRFLLSPPLHGNFLPTDEARAAHLLGRITWDNSPRFRLNRQQRNAATDRLLDYYRTHLPGLGRMASLDVLRHTFS